MRNVVFGDTGGWLPQLLAAFDELNIDAVESTMPKDLRVIHLGDLIHKGPFSSQLLAIVTGLMVKNPGQWVQLMGNHEAQHIRGAPVFWPCECDDADVGLINVLHSEKLLLPTFGLKDDAPFIFTPEEKFNKPSTHMFFSHGGLTMGFWDWAVGGVPDAVEASRRLNLLPIHEVTVPGVMLGENRPTSRVGPVWAVGNNEVFSSWKEVGTDMPFSQLHGHTQSYMYDYKTWWNGLEEFRKTATLVPAMRGVASELNNNLMLGLDPGFSEGPPRIKAQPYFEFFTLQ